MEIFAAGSDFFLLSYPINHLAQLHIHLVTFWRATHPHAINQFKSSLICKNTVCVGEQCNKQ